MTRISVPNLLWYGNQPRELVFPDAWEVELLEPPGFSQPALGPEGIAESIRAPIGSPTLAELAADAHEVVIAFDDITRPTPVYAVLPEVLRTLAEAGVADSAIRFIPALGTHGAMHNIDYRKKLGAGIVERFPIYNHNPYENCDYLGESASGVPVFINREFMSCDLKIGIGSIAPHVHVGFSGGGKLVMPGLAGMETIAFFHGEVMARDPMSCGLGKFDGNVMYEAVKEVVRMSGLRFKIDALLNARGEIAGLYAGDPVSAHLAGVEEARGHYGTRPAAGRNIMVVNAYAKYNEMAICMLMGIFGLDPAGGTIVILVDAPEGQACHYLLRSFGKDYGGRLYVKKQPPPETWKVIVCATWPDRTMCDFFAPADTVTVTRDWDETLALLEADYPDGARVGVVLDGTMQYYRL